MEQTTYGTYQYAGYTAIQDYSYADGTHDWNLFSPDGETGSMVPGKTVASLKIYIDDLLENEND